MKCTGECCQKIYLSHSRESLRILKDEGNIQAALIWTLMPLKTIEPESVRCVALSSTGCLLSYNERPIMCSTFPYDKCSICGSYSDAEARGVALALYFRPNL